MESVRFFISQNDEKLRDFLHSEATAVWNFIFLEGMDAPS